MQMRSIFNNKISATGLVEVITVLAIMAFTMVAIVGVTVRGMRQVKKNEVEDRAVGIQIRSLEYAKSPASLNIPPMENGDILYFSVDTSSGIQLSSVAGATIIDETNCDINSPYHVDLGTGNKDMICNQIIVEAKLNPSTSTLFYEIKSRLVFRALEDFEIRELLAYRSENF